MENRCNDGDGLISSKGLKLGKLYKDARSVLLVQSGLR